MLKTFSIPFLYFNPFQKWLLVFFGFFVWCSEATAEYIRPAHVSEEAWNTLSPYFLPETFPEKAILDEVFSKRRVLKSIKSMIKSGFFILTDPKDKIIVAKHINIKKYLIKVYLDGMPIAEWDCWRRRLRGVQVIQEAIERHGFQNIMKTPKKWVYPLPPSPLPPEQDGKNFILVVEEIDILKDRKNRAAYKKKMTPEILEAFYLMLTEYRLLDSVYADNTPFCKDGRMAFIDTEWTGSKRQTMPLSAVAQYLSAEMLPYWQELVHRK